MANGEQPKGGIALPLVPQKAIDWLAGQSFNNVLLVSILVFMGCAAYYAVNQIPLHLKQIQEGYEKIELNHTRQVESNVKAFTEDQERDSKLVDELLRLKTQQQ